MFFLTSRCASRADDPVNATALADSEGHNQNPWRCLADQRLSILVRGGVLLIELDQGERIVESHDRFLERDPVLFLVALGFGRVPIEVHIKYIPKALPIYPENRIMGLGKSAV